MDDLITRITTTTGMQADTAKKAVGAILGFLKAEGPTKEVGEVMAKVPGAEAMGNGGYNGGGLMGLAGNLTDLGLDMDQMQTVGREVFAYAREKAGEDTVGEIVGAVPGLSQFA